MASECARRAHYGTSSRLHCNSRIGGAGIGAFIDCVRDLEWELKRSYVLIVRNAQELLADDAPDALEHLFGVLDRLAEWLSTEWQESHDLRRPPPPFHVVFHASDRSAWLRRLAGVAPTVVNLPVRNPASWD